MDKKERTNMNAGFGILLTISGVAIGGFVSAYVDMVRKNEFPPLHFFIGGVSVLPGWAYFLFNSCF